MHAARNLAGYLGTAVVAALVIDWHWELAQRMAVQPGINEAWTATVAGCFSAALGDVGLMLGVFFLGAVWARDKRWTQSGSFKSYAMLSALGVIWAIALEALERRFGLRMYSVAMPLIPGLRVGALPVVQAAVVIPLAFAFANRNDRRRLP